MSKTKNYFNFAKTSEYTGTYNLVYQLVQLETAYKAIMDAEKANDSAGNLKLNQQRFSYTRYKNGFKRMIEELRNEIKGYAPQNLLAMIEKEVRAQMYLEESQQRDYRADYLNEFSHAPKKTMAKLVQQRAGKV